MFFCGNRCTAPTYSLLFFLRKTAQPAAPTAATTNTPTMTISTVLPALCSGALEDEGKRDAVAVRAGAAVPLALGVAVGAVTVGRGVAIVLLSRGVGVGVGVGVDESSGIGSETFPFTKPLINSSSSIACFPFSSSPLITVG